MRKQWLFRTQGVEVVRSSWTDEPRDLPNGWQSLDRPRISFPESPVIFGGQKSTEMIVPGGSIILDAEREHGVRQVKETSGQSIWIGLDPVVFEGLCPLQTQRRLRWAPGNTGRCVLPPDDRSLLALRSFVRCAEEGTLDPIEGEALMYAIVERMCRLGARCKPRGRRNAPTACVHVEAVAHAVSLLHNQDDGLTLDEIGREVHLSAHHFCRVFKRYTGMTVHGFRMRTRLLTAAERVLAGDDPLSKVAHECGFSDQSHMTRSFRRAFGVSPARLGEDSPGLGHMRTIVQDASSMRR